MQSGAATDECALSIGARAEARGADVGRRGDRLRHEIGDDRRMIGTE